MLFLSIGSVYFLNMCIRVPHAQNFKSFWTVYTKLPHHFYLFCLPFGSHSKHHNPCNIHLKSESVTGQPASKLVVMRKLPGSSQTVVLVLKMKVFAKTVLKHFLQTMFMKTVYILRSSFTDKLSWRPHKLYTPWYGAQGRLAVKNQLLISCTVTS